MRQNKKVKEESIVDTVAALFEEARNRTVPEGFRELDNNEIVMETDFIYIKDEWRNFNTFTHWVNTLVGDIYPGKGSWFKIIRKCLSPISEENKTKIITLLKNARALNADSAKFIDKENVDLCEQMIELGIVAKYNGKFYLKNFKI